MQFFKMHGSGNDFIILEQDVLQFDKGSRLAKQLCDRHFGIGADGLMIPEQQGADFFMHFYNADGSLAKMCGNGLRCFAAYLHKRYALDHNFVVQTPAGPYPVEVEVDSLGNTLVRADMGRVYEGIEGLDQGTLTLTLKDETHHLELYTMGVPHVVSDTWPEDLDTTGAWIASAPVFPEGTNVNFVKVIDAHAFEMVTWERGVGLTLACGTGACSAMFALYAQGKIKEEVTVYPPGGPLTVSLVNNRVFLAGQVVWIASGQFLKEVT